MVLQRRGTDEASSTAWVGRYVVPLLQLFTLVAFTLGALQVWIAAKFVTKDEMAQLQAALLRSHAEHMRDYQTTREGMEDVTRLLDERLPGPKHRRTREE